MSLYLVTGPLNYNDHETGETFEALLEPAAEQRALARGSITLIERSTPGLRPGSYRPPRRWPSSQLLEPAEAGFVLKEA